MRSLFNIRQCLVMSRDSEDRDSGDMIKDRILFGNDVQDKVIIFIYCLVMVDKIIKYKKIIYF